MDKLKELLYSNLPTMTKEQYQKYAQEAENGYITIKPHPEDENIVILNYTDQTTYEKRWNHETMTARGLILDITDENDIKILATPFPKFFNYGENPEYEKDINFKEQPIVMEKMDGSLGISYFFNGEIRFATRGSFTSEQAIKATEIWKRKYAHKFLIHEGDSFFYNPYTLLVEIIYPENRIVVDYKGLEDLVLIGAITHTKNNFIDWEYKALVDYAKTFSMSVAKQYKLTLDKMLEMKKSLSANEEGWVLRFSNGKRLKIKGDEYLQVHRIMHGLSDKAKFEAWAEGKLNELIMMLPEEFRNELEDFGNTLDFAVSLKKQILQGKFENIKNTTETRKDFALKVNEEIPQEYRHIMFKAYNTGEIDENLIKQYIYKNYQDYLDVVNLKSNVNNNE